MIIPYRITQGDSVDLSYYNENYSPDDWTLKASIRGYSSFDITFQNDGNGGFFYKITPAESSSFNPGFYSYSVYLYNAEDKRTIESGPLEIAIDISAITDPIDTRSHAKKVIDAVESVIEGMANTDAKQMMIDGRQLTRFSHSELLRLRAKYKLEYESELSKSGGIKAGSGMVKNSL